VPCKKRREKVKQIKTKKDEKENFAVGAFKKKEKRVQGPMCDSNFY
jgi:hypothetical protein